MFHKKQNISRTAILGCVFLLLFSSLVLRLFDLQIVDGESYANNFEIKTKKERAIKGTRGNIYDRKGKLLASDKLVSCITMEDNGEYRTTREKQLTLNSTAYKVLQIALLNNEQINNELEISIDSKNEYVFNVEGTQLDRFRADIFGKAKISELDKEQANTSAEDIITYLASEKRFAIYQENNKKYKKEELKKYDFPSEFTKQELLNILNIRYMLSLNTYKRYLPITVSTDVSKQTVAYIMENKASLPGVDITDDTIRVYHGGESFAHILGYTGKISEDEYEKLKENNSSYHNNSVIGKTGIEQYMESSLQGIDGTEEVYVNNVGKVISANINRVEPTLGKDVYLSIDKELQTATYQILEQRIAGILVSKIANIKTFNKSNVRDASDILIPIYDVYFALIDNNIIDIQRLEATEATQLEKEIQNKFEAKKITELERISSELTQIETPYKNLREDMKEYQSYIVNELLSNKTKIISKGFIDQSDPMYIAWTKEEKISLKEYLLYGITKGWVDMKKIPSKANYVDTNKAYELLVKEILKQLETDHKFNKMVYKSMLQDGNISGTDICKLLYEQKVLSKEDEDYEGLMNGSISAYSFMLNKIKKLEITPAQLALDPCSGSVVIVEPNTGKVLVSVSYPGYDNNRLVNEMDSKYYNQMYNDLSVPFYNRATQQLTAPGSTFKPITVIAGMQENVITAGTSVLCNGVFDKVEPPLKCWKRSGHGNIVNAASALQNSCNDYLCEITYRLGLSGGNQFSESKSLEKLQSYIKLFDLDKKSGIEITETEPHMTDRYAIPSAIGQGTHNYATVQLGRYVNTLANRGTSYQLSLLDKIVEQNGNLIEKLEPKVQNDIKLSDNIWDNINAGMKQFAQNNSTLKDMGISVAGKTGTAQESKTRPDHALFIGYAPVINPELSIAVRIPNGYTSGNSVGVTKDILNYYFELEDKETILTGRATQGSTYIQAD